MKFSEETQKLVDIHKQKEFAIGDTVSFTGLGNGSKDPTSKSSGKIVDIVGDIAKVKAIHGRGVFDKKLSEIKQSVLDIGKSPLDIRRGHQNYSISVGQLLSRMGYNNYGEPLTDSLGTTVDGIIECNTEPVVLDNEGDYIYYQIGLVWSVEDKQKLIRSIYNDIPIGNVVFRVRSYKNAKLDLTNGHPQPSWNDLVDGKQRVDAILGFVRGEYTDHLGNHWGDLSIRSRSQFLSRNNLLFIKMNEDSTDKEVLEYFILLNDTGKQVEKSLIDTNKMTLSRM